MFTTMFVFDHHRNAVVAVDFILLLLSSSQPSFPKSICFVPTFSTILSFTATNLAKQTRAKEDIKNKKKRKEKKQNTV